ncbi:MAG: hypothetical protein NZM38_09085 [Cytophagales bacterium]|nr:hypothetical protein [Cytophagales bacterium]MDW8384912.1 hypothetical protein [Flammeovirgaceae bacterium]
MRAFTATRVFIITIFLLLCLSSYGSGLSKTYQFFCTPPPFTKDTTFREEIYVRPQKEKEPISEPETKPSVVYRPTAPYGCRKQPSYVKEILRAIFIQVLIEIVIRVLMEILILTVDAILR